MIISSYKTIQQPAEAVVKEKGSSFIAEVYPVQVLEKFQKLLAGTKKKHYDASHHCYAVRLVSGYEKYSDDGEPSGTAGVRILNAINYHNLTDVAIIVTRYFGGTKLGVGPLGVAYSQAAMSCLSGVTIVEKHAYIPLEIIVSFEQTNQMYHLFSTHQIKIRDTQFTEQVAYNIQLRSDDKERFLKALDALLGGKYKLSESGAVEYL